MERVPHIAGDKYSPDIFAFDPFYAQERLSMAQVLARAQQQVDALSLLSEEEADDIPVWKILAVLAVSATVALALRRYYVRRRGEPGPGEGRTVDPGQTDGGL